MTKQAQSERGFLSVEDFERVTRAGQPRIDVCIQRERERGGRPNGRYIGFTVALDGTTTEIVAGSAAHHSWLHA